MMEFFRKHKLLIYTVTITGFLGGIIIGFGGYLFGPFKTFDSVASINGVKIPYAKFRYYLNMSLDQFRESETEITPEITQKEKTETLQQLIQQEIFYQQAKKLGIIVSDRELASRIQSIPAFQTDGRFNQQVYIETVVRRFKTSTEEFEEEQRREIAGFKLRRFLSLNMSVSDGQIERAFSLKYAPGSEAINEELKKIEATEDELKEAFKAENEGKLDGYSRRKTAFAKTYKQNKLKNQFSEQYKNRLFSQFMNDWFQKTVSESKIKVFLNEIEKAEQKAEKAAERG